MFESKRHKLASPAKFRSRLLKCFGIALVIITIALSIGVLGYHILANQGWVDSLLNASMILGGMGPVAELQTDAPKIFASLYALFSGIVFIALMGIILAPFAHRALHLFHLDEKDIDEQPKQK
ncbi:MAG: hypothetical protein JWO89_3522 [Verrucomicrobiaceae bacterium]|nr:hypothetical protein [Verrucomicrobiaceae bacterium]